MVIGFPSLLREIEYAIKRAGSENVLGAKTLRTSEIPQTSFDPKDAVNLAEYNYFVLSKISPNTQAGYSFLTYLATREAEEKYLQNFPTYLPAQRNQEEARMTEAMSKEYDRVKYRSFMNSEINLQSFDKGLKNKYDTYFSQTL
jgi:spermidine/putrescine-binding protein